MQHILWKRTSGPDHSVKSLAVENPEPTPTAPAERLQPAISVEHFDIGPGHWVDVEERLMVCALSEVGDPRHHAALSAGSARAKPRR